MAVNLSPVGGVAAQFFDNNGVILSGGKIYTYAAGTTTNQATYTSAAGNTAHTNPIILDSAGRVPSGEIWLTDGLQYKFVLKNANDVLIGTYDNIAGINPTVNASQVVYTPAGAGAVSTTVQTKLRESVSVKDFGAVGNGTTDDTAFIQAAISASYGKNLFFPSGTYLCSKVTVIDDIQIYGEPGSIVKHIANSADAMIQLSGTAFAFQADNLTFDGNWTNQSNTTYSIRHNAVGTTSSQSIFEVTNCQFLNGNYADIFINTDTSLLTFDVVKIENNTFFNGAEGTATIDRRCIHISSPCEIDISHNNFNLGYTPTTYGRAGVVSFVSGYSGKSSRGSISNNYFRNIGRSSATTNGTLGAIDGYAGSNSLVIDGNTLINSYGRGIQIKSDASDVVISNNAVEGLLDLTSGAAIDSLITVNRSVTTTVYGHVAIVGNVCKDSVNDGISVSCANTDFTDSANSILISSNIVFTAARRGIGLYKAINASISNNIVSGGCSEYGIVANTYDGSSSILIDNNHVTVVTGQGIRCDTLENIGVFNNVLRGNTGEDIFIRTVTKGLVKNNQMFSTTPLNTGPVSGVTGVLFEQNFTSNNINSGLYRPTIASGVINATFNFLEMRTEGGAALDNLDTINGGYDGMVLTLQTYLNTEDVVVKNGTGNLVMASDFTLDSNLKTITFVKIGSSWYETCRSSNT